MIYKSADELAFLVDEECKTKEEAVSMLKEAEGYMYRLVKTGQTVTKDYNYDYYDLYVRKAPGLGLDNTMAKRSLTFSKKR